MVWKLDAMNDYSQNQVTPCPECGGERVVATITDTTSFTLTSPNADVWHGHKRVYLRDWALVCTYCGYLALFVKNPLALVKKRPDEPIQEQS